MVRTDLEKAGKTNLVGRDLYNRLEGLEGSGGGELPNLTEYAKLEDLDTATKFTAMNPTLDTPAPEVLDKVVTDIENEVKTNTTSINTNTTNIATNTTAITDLTGRVTNLENSGGGENTFYWDLSTDGLDVDCSQIDKKCKTLHLITITSTIGKIIYVFNLSESSIRMITSTTALRYVVNEDINADLSIGITNMVNLDDLTGDIFFYTGDKVDATLFKCKVMACSQIAFGNNPYLSLCTVNGVLFSIEFSEDFLRVISYFNYNECFVPFTYTNATQVFAHFDSYVFYYTKWLNDTSLSISTYKQYSIFQAGTSGNTNNVYHFDKSVITCPYHVPILLVAGSIKDYITTRIYNRVLAHVSGTSANETVKADVLINQTYITGSSESRQNPSRVKLYRDIMIGSEREYKSGENIFNRGYVSCFGASTDITASITGWNWSDTTRNEYTPSIGLYTTLSIIMHAWASCIYFEKGEFSFPVNLSRLKPVDKEQKATGIGKKLD